MAAKTILVICAQALFIQFAFSACTSRAAVETSGIGSPFGYAGSFAPGLAYDRFSAPAWGYDGIAYSGAGCPGRGLAYDGFYSPAMKFTATSGGALPVTSSSATSPVGISIVSENVIEGALRVAGKLPFEGTTAVDGVLATAGAGAINYACGNGLNVISALSGTSTPGFAAPALAYDALPYADAVWTGRGLACDGLTYGSPLNGIEITPISGGALPVSSATAMSPTGIAVVSDNAYEGALAVGGELPFVGTVAVEGAVLSAGSGAVNHACGNGRNAMISETSAFGSVGPYAPMGAYGPATAFACNEFAPGFGASPFGYRGGAVRECGYAY